jgi:dipeptidyl-peptidase 4
MPKPLPAFVAALVLSPVLAAFSAAQTPSKAFIETLKAEFVRGEYNPKSPQESKWMDGGKRYTILEPAAGHPDRRDLVAYETATGSRNILVPAERFIPAGAKEPLKVKGYSWSEDNALLLIFTNSQKVWRLNTRGDYWVLRLSDGKLTQLGKSIPAASLMFCKFSPDSKSVAYVSNNNVYAENLETGAITQLTSDGSYELINGTTDWVTEEEFGLRDAFRWSPDSKSIAYWQFDQSGVSEYTLINDTKAKYPETFHYKYPQPGGTNASVRVGIVAASGGNTTWVKLPGDPRNNYIPRMEWIPSSHADKAGEPGANSLILQHLNRLQNDNQVYIADAATGDAHMIFEDKDPAWVEIVESFEWLSSTCSTCPIQHSKTKFLWLSERDGWRHAYVVDISDGKPQLITNFPADVIGEVSVDDAGGWFYFLASPANPTQRYLYRSRLDGTGTPERITPTTQSGRHSYNVAPSGRYAIHSYSNANRPVTFDLVELSTHKLLRTVVDNQELIAKDAAIDPNPVELLDTPVSGGVTLSTMLIKPPNFDPKKKYPLLVNVYSEPAACLVQDAWGYTFDKIIAREGYLIVSFDNQGTPAPKGHAWRKSIYGNIGVLSSQQQDEAIAEFAKEHPYVDATRIGMWGHSGGGSATLNQMFRYPGHVAAGVAIAPMPDQTLYDTIYQERYMGLPSDNAKGYHDGSPVTFAEGLTGNLLIIHGSGDDNVHFQGTEMLVDKLVALGKPFDFMDYPNRTHALSEGQGTLQHRFILMMHFFEEHVPAGPR